MKALKNEHTDQGMFSNLPEQTQDMIKEAIKDAFEARSLPDVYPYGDDAIESIECERRDGFIPFSHNKGGLQLRAFTDLMGFWGGGYTVAHKGAQAEIERQTEYAFKCASEATYERFKEFFDAAKVAPKDCTYPNLQELAEQSGGNSFDEVLRFIEDAEMGCLSGDENSIMFEIRFMYHGLENGIHKASVSAAVNTEGPYHRSHISWAPNVFCEGYKEVEITWRTEGGLKRKLAKALKDVTSKVL